MKSVIKTRAILIIYIMCATLFVSSCISYHAKIDVKAVNELKKQAKQTAFVSNSQSFKTEYKILKKSKLYNLTNDSNASIKIQLNKLTRYHFRGCATPQFVLLLFGLGQIPVYFDEQYLYQFNEVRDNEIKPIQLKLKLERRVWFWNILSWRKSLNRELSLALKSEKAKGNY